MPLALPRTGEPLWVNFEFLNGERGAHVNISGMALAKNAPNKENAIKLVEFLSGDEVPEGATNEVVGGAAAGLGIAAQLE